MISFLIKYKKAILIITLAFFIGSIGYIGLDSYRRGSFSSNVAMVGSQPITYRDLYKAADAQARVLRNNGVDVDEELNQYLKQQVLSGLISEEGHWAELMTFDMDHPDYGKLQQLVGESVQIKERIVAQDPFEQGIRKALNLGHTIGHAFESFALEREAPVLHGYAVAWGMVCELYLAHQKTGFPTDKMRQTVQFIKENYGKLAFNCRDYDRLYEFMKHDKKNAAAGMINFTLLGGIGDIRINQTATKEEINEALDFYCETMG